MPVTATKIDKVGPFSKLELTGAGTSDPVIVSSQEQGLTIGAVPVGGTAQVEYSIDPVEEIENNTADWFPWGMGAVSTPTRQALYTPITAARIISVGGGAFLKIRGS